MKRAIKTISLTIDELTQLLAIDDPMARQSIAEAVRTEVVDETAAIENPSEPMIECLVEKIRKKRRAAECRRQARERRILEAAERCCPEDDGNKKEDFGSEKTVMFEAGVSLLELVKNDSPQMLPINPSAVTKILNVVYHHRSWFDNFFELFDRLPESSAIGLMVKQTKNSIKHLESYIPKLKELAQKYYSIPLLDRPSEVWL